MQRKLQKIAGNFRNSDSASRSIARVRIGGELKQNSFLFPCLFSATRPEGTRLVRTGRTIAVFTVRTNTGIARLSLVFVLLSKGERKLAQIFGLQEPITVFTHRIYNGFLYSVKITRAKVSFPLHPEFNLKRASVG